MGKTKCKVPDCTSSDRLQSHELRHHRFPRDEQLRNKWRKFCGLKKSDVTRTSAMCSEHFDEDCYEKDLKAAFGMKSKPRLLPDGE